MIINFWQNTITEHQADTISELSYLINKPINVFYFHKSRKNHNWELPSYNNIIFIKISFKSLFNNLFKKKYINIFASPVESYKIYIILLLHCFFNKNTSIISEPYCTLSYSLIGEKNFFLSINKYKLIIYKYIIFNIIKNKINKVFAISNLAIEQYLYFNIPSNKIIPFAYYIYPKSTNCIHYSNDKLRLVYVGNILEIKGIDLLITYMKKLENKNVILDIYGHGDLSKYILPSNTFYKGVFKFGTATDVICKYDFLVLLSRYDGWGVVINEAIHALTPIICSNNVGSSIFVKNYSVGHVINHNDFCDLIDYIIKSKQSKLDFHENLTFASKLTQPQIGAKILLNNILNYD